MSHENARKVKFNFSFHVKKLSAVIKEQNNKKVYFTRNFFFTTFSLLLGNFFIIRTLYYSRMSTYVLGTFRIEGCLMKMMHTVQFPMIPTTKITENNIGTKYVSMRAEYGTKSKSSSALLLLIQSLKLSMIVIFYNLTLCTI